MQRAAAEVYVDRQVAEYAVALCRATRDPDRYGIPGVAADVAYGASPRGSIALVRGAQALALLHGRSYALPRDIQDLAPDVLRHRVVLTYEALAEGVSPDHVLAAVLGGVVPPRLDLARGGAA